MIVRKIRMSADGHRWWCSAVSRVALVQHCRLVSTSVLWIIQRVWVISSIVIMIRVIGCVTDFHCLRCADYEGILQRQFSRAVWRAVVGERVEDNLGDGGLDISDWRSYGISGCKLDLWQIWKTRSTGVWKCMRNWRGAFVFTDALIELRWSIDARATLSGWVECNYDVNFWHRSNLWLPSGSFISEFLFLVAPNSKWS